MKTYPEKIAYLKSLIVEVKSYAFEELEKLLELDMVEDMLNMPEVINRQWEYEPLHIQKSFNNFLDSYSRILEKVIRKIKANNRFY